MTAKKKKAKSVVDRAIAWLHLWPSIVSGIIVVFVCLTGTLIVYCDEIMEWTAGDARFVPIGETRITESEMRESLHKFNPDIAVSEYVFFRDPARSIRIRCWDETKESLYQLYMDPYTGEILKLDATIYFFYVTAHLHASLLAGDIGYWLVIISTIIFVVSCLTGLVLWWPKRWTRTTRLASFTVKWKAKFKRLNYDLHNVYGFYSLALCLILGISGLMISFHSWMEFTVKAVGGDLTHLDEALPPPVEGKKGLDLVPLAYEALAENPGKRAASIWAYNLDEEGAYVFHLGIPGLKSFENMELAVFDKYSGLPIAVSRGQQLHEKTENTVWQLHMGQWWGQLGKFSTFLAGAVATTLPITGFIIWWGKRKKKPRKCLRKPIDETILVK